MPKKPSIKEKEYAFALKSGQYRFMIAESDGIIRVFIEGEKSKECCLQLSFAEYQNMADNFSSFPKLFQGTQN